MKPRVAVIMGSKSDLRVMQRCLDVLTEVSVAYTAEVVSAHRTPEHMVAYAKQAAGKGIQIIIAAAGGAAHLPGMVASLTPLPVIGVPIHSSNSILGLDSLLSIVQMPKGVPVATVAVDGAENAALLAVRMLGITDKTLQKKITNYAQARKAAVMDEKEIS